MRDWTDQPEAAGPQSESDLSRPGYGLPGYPSIGRITPPATYPDPVPADRETRTMVQVSGPESAEPEAEPVQQVPEPAPDPSAAAIERTLQAEAAADAGKTVPADATVVTS